MCEYILRGVMKECRSGGSDQESAARRGSDAEWEICDEGLSMALSEGATCSEPAGGSSPPNKSRMPGRSCRRDRPRITRPPVGDEGTRR